MWSWYNLLTSHSWILYLTLPQLSTIRASTILGNSQETIIGSSWGAPGGSLPAWGPVRSYKLCLQHDSMSWPLPCLVMKSDLLVGHWAAENHGIIVWLLGSTRWELIVSISCVVCETSQRWVNFNNSTGKQNRASPQVWPQDCHLWPYTTAALGAFPGGRSSQAHRSVFPFQRCHQRLFYVLLMVLLGCFLSEVSLLDEFVCF